MIWDSNGYPVKGCCAKCVRGTKAFGETSCGKPACGCHDDPAFVAGSDSLGAQGHDNGSGVLADRYDTVTPQTGVQQNEYPRRK